MFLEGLTVPFIKSEEGENMKCPNCGAMIDDDSKFCAECGQVIEVNNSQEPNQAGDKTEPEEKPAISQTEKPVVSQIVKPDVSGAAATEQKSETKDVNRIAKIVGLVIGAALIVIGITRIAAAGISVSSTSFGGDFYTYAYRGIVAIGQVLVRIEVSLGWVIVAIGAAIDISILTKWNS